MFFSLLQMRDVMNRQEIIVFKCFLNNKISHPSQEEWKISHIRCFLEASFDQGWKFTYWTLNAICCLFYHWREPWGRKTLRLVYRFQNEQVSSFRCVNWVMIVRSFLFSCDDTHKKRLQWEIFSIKNEMCLNFNVETNERHHVMWHTKEGEVNRKTIHLRVLMLFPSFLSCIVGNEVLLKNLLKKAFKEFLLRFVFCNVHKWRPISA